MKTIRKIAFWTGVVLVASAALLYLADDLWARFRGRPVEQVKVGRIFAEINRYNEVEYSAGLPIMETCIDALLPHFGLTPCWYLQKHKIQHIGP
ncbi:MAG TPA: hypothetical protein VGK48_03995 [Terriglobia bacterium]|jgi:hypothetical protein